MNQNNNCEIIRDLIPLCTEGLCSETSKQKIEEHIKDCENCRKLYEQLPQEEPATKAVPDESKTFRKVRKKMKRSLWRNILLSVALAAVVIPVGVLTVGECIKTYPIPSFSTVFQSIEVRQQMKRLFSGDIDGYMKKITYAEMNDICGVQIDINDAEIIRQQDTENIRKTYEAAYGNTKIQSIRVQSDHLGSYNTTSAVSTDATVHFVDGREVTLQFTKDYDGLYSVCALNHDGTAEEKAFANAIDFNAIHRLIPFDFLERLMIKNDQTIPSFKNRMQSIASRFQPIYREDLEKSLTEFYQKDYLVEDCMTNMRFDKEKEMLYHEVVLFAKDAQGTAILKTRFYSTYEGLIPPTEESITIYRDGCTDVLAEDLAKMFG